MANNYFKSISLFLILLACSYTQAQNVTVLIDPSCQRFLGDVSELDRTKYFNFHSGGSSSDTDIINFMNDYNVGIGRQFWGPFSYAKNQTGEVGSYPAFRNGDDNLRAVKRIIATEHPSSAFKDNISASIAADWAAEYYKDFVNSGDVPEFFEPMNEPFVHASDFYEGWNASENSRIKQQMSEFYSEIGKRIHDTPALNNMKVIGYSSAWPSVELEDFEHWEDNMKRFMDTAGENMDGFATHLYDGINVTGQDTFRSGSNSEAILDLIENYSYIKWGVVKPHAISEYGGIEAGYGDDFSLIANVQSIKSINHILFNLLERENRLSISIPFIGDKGLWHINEANNYQPYGAVLFIPSNIGEENPTGWHYTHRIHFFDLWKEFKGNRVLIKSDNPDIQAHAFANGNKMYVALSNLDSATQTIDLSMLTGLSEVESVTIKSLKIYDQTLPEFTNQTVTEAPNSLALIADETVTLEYTFSNSIEFENAIRSKNYYASNYLQTISANTAINYNFNGVTTGDGYATLRMGIGRKHNVSKQPIVKVNGVTIEVPSNWKGYDQAERDDFFGVIDIPFAANLLAENNTISIEFPDSEGRISSLILNVELFDKAQNTLGIESVGNPCPNEAKGVITINPLIADTYQFHITGTNLNKTSTFSSKHSIENLESGEYTIEITSTSDSEFREEYKINITEPENLLAKSKVDQINKKIVYTLKGGTNYTIKINNKTFTTSKSLIELPLTNGSNNIEITANKDCQGIYSENIVIGAAINAYPIPFSSKINIDLGLDTSKTSQISIYNSIGKKVYSNLHQIINGTTSIETTNLTSGVYIVSVTTETSSKNLKIIKN